MLLGLELFDARRSGTAPQRHFQPLNRFLLPFCEDLDPPVGQVADPAEHAFARGGVVREPAEADSLHAPRDHVTPRQPHGNRNYNVPRSTEISTTPTGSSCATKSASVSSASSSRSTGRYGRSCSVNETWAIS